MNELTITIDDFGHSGLEEYLMKLNGYSRCQYIK